MKKDDIKAQVRVELEVGVEVSAYRSWVAAGVAGSS